MRLDHSQSTALITGTNRNVQERIQDEDRTPDSVSVRTLARLGRWQDWWTVSLSPNVFQDHAGSDQGAVSAVAASGQQHGTPARGTPAPDARGTSAQRLRRSARRGTSARRAGPDASGDLHGAATAARGTRQGLGGGILLGGGLLRCDRNKNDSVNYNGNGG
jgi:hypothetical protein